MAHPRRVVADSDDDDDDERDEDEEVDLIAHDAATQGDEWQRDHSPSQRQKVPDVAQPPLSTPQAEPLSPEHRPRSRREERRRREEQGADSSFSNENHGDQSSDSTSQSVFARIAAAQQEKVLQQSRLIENIVRQSQRVVGVGADDNGNGNGAEVNGIWNADESSSASGQPHVVLGFDSTASSIPAQARKHDEWDIPSSPEAAEERLPTKSETRRTTTTRRARESLESIGEDATEGASKVTTDSVDDELTGHLSLPQAKRQRVSLHDTLGDSTKGFYVAPSHLTTMQKLEYQRVSVPQNSLTVEATKGTPISQQLKSSGATTIAYTTPSRYASSGGRYPWESSVVVEDEGDHEVINIPSSPDVFAQEGPSILPQLEADLPEAGPEASFASPVRSSIRGSGKKRKSVKKSADDEDEDELAGTDDMWAFQGKDEPEEAYRPRPSRRRMKAASPNKDETHGHESKPDEKHEEDELALTNNDEQTSAMGRKRRVEVHEDEEKTPEVAIVPKKRGRKKKQPPAAEMPVEATVVEDGAGAQHSEQNLEAGLSEDIVNELPEAPKKRRGRPKKSDKAKIASVAEPGADGQDNAVLNTKNEGDDQKNRTGVSADEEKRHSPSPKRTALETKDVNTGGSLKEVPKPEGDAGEMSSAKPVAKSSTPMGLQRTAQYRVGLSKKSRIAPLLKIIRK
ncbi:uncharacterized protein B0I36DRAFT_344399 [Microdochium trichocladiopsis]|uniref:Uncharacterized protein n=1 Tax=Microdochium trichocladiopsis TaxID=1682393 RepID=A0A9P8YIN2_9PEZI|nr:uncharacterized protein B0I36DRAFT_344399 [Microdochium trichocladiopsis]KAH7040702.1 hypothetical protein B0I36DRAFT_344399 [Microdochium trichocladiopsis]